MLRSAYTNQFDKDLKKMLRQGKNAQKLKNVIAKLIDEKPLDRQYRDRKLVGNYKGRRECHIESDWLLIYKLIENEIIFERTGTHSDLFE